MGKQFYDEPRGAGARIDASGLCVGDTVILADGDRMGIPDEYNGRRGTVIALGAYTGGIMWAQINFGPEGTLDTWYVMADSLIWPEDRANG